MSTLTPLEVLPHAIPQERPPGFWDGVARSYIPSGAEPAVALHEEADDAVDPVTAEVIRYALLATNFEHAALIQRLCVSPITMLTRDYQASVLTQRGDLVCLGANLQYFSTSHEMTVKWTLEHRAENPGIREGDIFLSNDPYVGAPHQSDTCVYGPVFVDGKLFCWVANSMHLSDVGGSQQGSFCITASDSWGDPPNFPPIRLVEDGVMREDLENLFVRQSRLPLANKMDVRAAVSAIAATRERILGLVERYGAATVKGVMDGLLDAGEALMRDRLARIPDGRWSHRIFTEAALPGDRNVYAYQVTLTKRGETLTVDNAGTDPQAGSINITYAAWAGASLAALCSQLVSDLAGAYGGAYRAIDFRPEPGLLNCAEHPGAVSPSGAFTTELQLNACAIATAKMLSCSTDETVRARALGPNLPHFYGAIGGGLDGAGNLFILANTNGMMGALGGTPVQDGADCGGHYWIPEGIAYNVEDLEDQYPVLYLYRRLLPLGADGAGRHRGGLGFEEGSLLWGGLGMQMEIYANESFPKGQGTLGANPGSRAFFALRAETGIAATLAGGELPQDVDTLGTEEPVGFKGPALMITPDHVFAWSSPTAAGFGDPLRRQATAVEADVAAELLDAATAERVYGVVPGDEEATTAARRAARTARLGREPGADVDPPAGAQRAGEELWTLDGRWWCHGADLGPVTETWKAGAELREHAVAELAPEFATPDAELSGMLIAREWLCPVTGYRLDLELSRAGEPPLADVLLGEPHP